MQRVKRIQIRFYEQPGWEVPVEHVRWRKIQVRRRALALPPAKPAEPGILRRESAA